MKPFEFMHGHLQHRKKPEPEGSGPTAPRHVQWRTFRILHKCHSMLTQPANGDMRTTHERHLLAHVFMDKMYAHLCNLFLTFSVNLYCSVLLVLIFFSLN
ncbi:hypothetical protein NQD34_007051 [Periophthalmus magnuspinnatus]|nr:hypothetical protein NQD34_007051 [Periophthalmus magnuspinnatus]